MALEIFRCIQKTSVPMGIAVFSYLLPGIPFAYLLAFPLGWEGAGFWAGPPIGLAFTAIVLFSRILRLYSKPSKGSG